MRTFFSFVVGGVVSAVVVGLVWLQVSLAQVGVVVVGAVCLAWLGVIVVLPWNLLFEARRALRELARARARGITVLDAQERRARAVERRMLRVSLSLHVVSAALLALGSWWAEVPLGSAFAALFLLSTLFRPAVEYYRFLRGELTELVDDSRYPRADVMKLIADVEAQGRQLVSDRLAREHLEHRMTETESRTDARLAEANRRLELVTRRFDETISQLTDNREIISGLRAFLRLVREEPVPGRG